MEQSSISLGFGLFYPQDSNTLAIDQHANCYLRQQVGG